MKLLHFLPIILIFIGSCRSPVLKPENKKIIIEDLNPFDMDNTQDSPRFEMVAWEFLKKNPSENEVIEFFGVPDSTWVDEYDEIKILYYYISEFQDYNFIEINLKSGNVSGFEWD